MSDSHPEPDDAVRDLVFECLERYDEEGESALTEICARHPDHASAIRRRFRILTEMGFIEDAQGDAFPERLGGFELKDVLGAGGMGVVYRARETALDRDVALKLIRPDHLYFPRAKERFRREVEAVARLTHPNIVPVHSVGKEDGIPYYAMELVEGKALSEVLEEVAVQAPPRPSGADLWRAINGGVDPTPPAFQGSWTDACLHVIEPAVRAIEHAHACGILHRDIKPSNLMIRRDGHVLVVDFGLARSEGARSITRSGAPLGSIPYMAPEQIRGDSDVDERTDVYGLGTTLYEMLTLRQAHDGISSDAVRQHILDGAQPAPRSVNPEISWEAETVCMTAMEVDRERRYATVGELRADMMRTLQRLPITARRPGPVQRLRRWAERHPARVLGLLLALVLLVITPTIVAVQQFRSSTRLEEERNTAQLERNIAQRERNAANESIRFGLEAVRRMLTRVARNDLVAEPHMDATRRRLFEDALEFYLRFLQNRPDDTALVIETASAWAQVGNIRRDLGDYDGAIEALRRAVEVARRVETPAGATALGSALLDAGDLRLRLDRAGEARDLYREARDTAAKGDTDRDRLYHARALAALAECEQKLGDFAAGERGYTEGLTLLRAIRPEGDMRAQAAAYEIHMLHGIAFIFAQTSRWDAAERDLLRAIELQKGIMAEPPIPEEILTLCQLQRRLGETYLHQGKAKEARAILEPSMAAFARLERLHPDVVEYGLFHLRTAGLIASVDRLQGRLDGSVESLRPCVEAARRLLKTHGDRRDFQEILAVTLIGLGTSLDALDRDDEAESAFEEGADLLAKLAADSPRRWLYRTHLGVARRFLGSLYRQAGEFEEADEALKEAIAIFGEVVAERPEVAVERARLSMTLHALADLRADQRRMRDSRQALEEAVEHGRIAVKTAPINTTYRISLAASLGRLAWTENRLGNFERVPDLMAELGPLGNSTLHRIRITGHLIEAVHSCRRNGTGPPAEKQDFIDRCVALICEQLEVLAEPLKLSAASVRDPRFAPIASEPAFVAFLEGLGS